MPKRIVALTVAIEGQSWGGIEQGFYNFEATVNGKPCQIRVSEEVAFDFLGGWTRSQMVCLDILRSHRSALAENLARKLRVGGRNVDSGLYSLTLRDLERFPALSKKRGNAVRPHRSSKASIAIRNQSVL